MYIYEIEPRFKETDMMGVIYHSNYFVWCEVARKKLGDETNLTHERFKEIGVMFPVRRVSAEYIRPVLYGKNVFIEIKVVSFSGVRLIYDYEITDKEGTVYSKLKTEHIVIDYNFRPVHLKRKSKELYEEIKALVYVI